MRIVFLAFVVAGMALVFALPSAQAQPGRAARVVVLHGDGPIHGRVQRPAAITILPRARVRHERAESRAHFLPEVARSVQRRPF
ncbi:MAG: hypothetical protein GXP55_07475 [Deltaproteobacteria bacterium]|nr:hypothetical protein [Deltaproteobacteria bacterium]